MNKKGKEDENISGQRQSIELVLAKGSKYLTKEKEIEERKSSEVKLITDDISPPPYISTKKKKQKAEFDRIANQRSFQSDFIIQIV